MKSYTFNPQLVTKVAVCIFVLLSLWWLIVAFLLENKSVNSNLYWAASYQLMAVFGGVFGLIISRSWGGFKSTVGKTIIFFSTGLLLQVFGQSVFSFYNLVLGVEIPYPSLADIGFFLSVPFYIYAAYLLGKASGVLISLKSIYNKIQSILIPAGVLVISYFIFLKGYEFDWSTPLKIFLDFGYPFGQAIYIAFALLVYMLSRDYLGGIMRSKVLMILLALIVQYIAEYNFLYQASNQTWVNGGYGDYIYLISYFLMTIALINMSSAFKQIKET